jgi:hypothetical protein
MLDLKTLDITEAANAGQVMEVLHPATNQPLEDDEGEPVLITLAGIDSEVFRKAQRAATNRRLAVKGRTKITADELEQDALEALVACTLDWSGIAIGGEVLECTKANVRKVYTEFRWLREQVDEFVGDRAGFLKK